MILLIHLKFIRFVSFLGLTSANPLLEFCLDGGLSRKNAADSKDSASKSCKEADTNFQSPFLTASTKVLSHCSTCSRVQTCSDKGQFVSQLRMHLRQTGCDINVHDSQGFTALHHLIQGSVTHSLARGSCNSCFKNSHFVKPRFHCSELRMLN